MANENTPRPMTLAESLAAMSPAYGEALTRPEVKPSVSDEKRKAVVTATELKRFLLDGGSGDITAMATAQREGNDLGETPMGQALQEPIGTMAMRYGPEAALANQRLLTEGRRINTVENKTRSPQELDRDFFSGTAAGLVQSLGGVGAFGAGMVNDQAGEVTSRAVEEASAWLRDKQTPVLKDQIAQGGVRRELDRQDIDAQYERDLEDGTSYPGWRRFGREALAMGSDLREHPELAGNLVSEGVGSLIGGAGLNGLAVRGLAKVALAKQGLKGAEATQFLKTPAGREMLQTFGRRGMPASIGAMEGGGVLIEVQTEILGMDEEELMEGSEEYRAFRSQNMTHEEARSKLAGMAGREGGAIQAVVGALTGIGVARIEADPLNMTGQSSRSFMQSLRGLGSDATKEFGEEAIQSGSGSYVSGSMIQNYADPTRDPGEGLGGDVVQGGVAGAGTAGAMRGPGVAAAGIDDALMTLGRNTASEFQTIGAGISNAVSTRMANLEAEGEAASVVSDSAREGASVSAQESLEKLHTSLRESTGNVPTDPVAVGEAEVGTTIPTPIQEATARVHGVLLMQSEEVNAVPSSVQKMILNPGETFPEGAELPRLHTMNAVVEELKANTHTGADKLDAALWVYDQAMRIGATQGADVSGLSADQQALHTESLEAINTILENPTVKAAIEQARNTTSEEVGTMPTITDVNVDTPQIRDAINRTVLMAQSNPAGIDPKFVGEILDQRAKGRLNLQDAVVARLKAAAALATDYNEATTTKNELLAAAQDAVAKNVKLVSEGGKPASKPVDPAKLKTHDIVHQEILHIGMKAQDKTGQWGLSRHMSEIVTALVQGRVDEAQNFMENLRAFGEHMQNKAEAASKSAALNRAHNNKIPYRTWTGSRWLDAKHQYASSIYVNPNAPDSLLAGREAVVDAQTVTNTYNNLLTIFGDRISGKALMAVAAADILRAPVGTSTTTTTTQPDVPETETNSAAQRAEAATVEETSTQKEDPKPKDLKPTYVNRPVVNSAEIVAWAESQGFPSMLPADELHVTVVFSKTPVDRATDAFKAHKGKIQSIGGERSIEQFGEAVVLKFEDPILQKRWQETQDAGAAWDFDQYSPHVTITYEAGDLDLSKIEPFQGEIILGPEQIEDIKEDAKDSFEEVRVVEPIAEETTPETLPAAKEEERPSENQENDPEATTDSAPNSGPEVEKSSAKKAGDEDRSDDGETGSTPDDGTGSDGDLAREDSGTGTPDPAEELSFENLARSKNGLNRFQNAYRIVAGKSKTLVHKSPLAFVLETLNNLDTPESTVDLEYSTDTVAKGQLVKLVEFVVPAVVKQMNEDLHKPGKTLSVGTIKEGNKRQITPLEAISDKTTFDYLGARENRGLNIVDPETQTYDPRLLETAVLAAIDWVLTSPAEENLDVEKVAKFLKIEEHQVTPEMLNGFRKGLRATIAGETLAARIREFWGAELKDDAYLSDSLGISQALAADILNNLDGLLVEETKVSVGETPDGKPKHTQVFLLRHERSKDYLKTIGGMKNLLGDIIVPTRDKPFHFSKKGEMPEMKRHLTQKRNPGAKLSKKQRQAIERQQKTPFMRNTAVMNMLSGLGAELYAELKGYQQVDKATTNKQDFASIDGKNTSIISSWDGLIAHDQMLHAYAEKQGLDPSEVETHFDWYAISNERIHAEGFNPQANKTMRDAYTATNAVVDMTDPANQDLFWLTVGQALGLETERLYRAETVESAQTGVETYRDTIEVLKLTLGSDAELTQEQRNTVRENLADNKEDVDKLLHALLSVAKYELAQAEGPGSFEMKNFEHNLALEADGKTDGPISAMVHFIAGKFKSEHLTNLAKGGFFLGSSRKTISEHVRLDFADLYETAATNMKSYLGQRQAELKAYPEARRQMVALLKLMGRLGKVSFDEAGNLVLGRNVLKNPLTITVYGSSKNGIAGKITAALLDKLYAEMSAVARGETSGLPAEVTDALGLLMTQSAAKNRKTGEWFVSKTVGKNKMRRSAPLKGIQNPVTYAFSDANKEMLSQNILNLFVEPMSYAIADLIGDATNTLEMFQKTTQVQSAFLVGRFRQLVKDRLSEKRKAGELGNQDFLTKTDYDQIFQDVSRYGVVIQGIDTQEHYLDLAHKENAPEGDDFFGSLQGGFRGKARLGAPSQASVRALPLLTISRGDAEMMVNFFASESVPDDMANRVLAVFDGMEMPLDGIETISELINQAVSDAWMTNPAQDAVDSFSDWLRQGEKGPLEGVTDPETWEAVQKVFPDLVMEPGVTDLTERLTELRDQMAEAAMSIAARKRVMQRVGYSNDHMSSGENPYVVEGEPFEGDLVDAMNTMYDEELAKLREASKDPAQNQDRDTIETPSTLFQSRIEAYGQILTGTEVRMLSSKQALKMVTDPEVPEHSRNVGKVLATHLPKFTYYFGSVKELTELRNRISPELRDAGSIQNGQIDLIGGKIFITNGASETVLHEMMHAATAKSIYEFYDNPALLDPTQRDAMGNLESLMTQFLDMNFTRESAAVSESAALLKSEIERHRASSKGLGKARAMSEFVAWTMTNQNLVDVLRKSRVRTPLRSLVHRAIGQIMRLLGIPQGTRMDMFSNIAMNTAALIVENGISDTSLKVPAGEILNQISGKPTDQRLLRLMQGFDRKVASHLKTLDIKIKINEEPKIQILADRAVNLFTSNGFDLDDQQKAAFRSIQVALASTAEMNSVALVRLEKLFTHVVKGLSVEDLMADATKDDPNDRARANERFNVITGKYGFETDREGRINLMTSFLALSQVDPEFRDLLDRVSLPKKTNLNYKSVDDLLTSAANSMLDTLEIYLADGSKETGSTKVAIDRLAATLSKIDTDNQLLVEKQMHNALGTMDTHVAKLVSKGSDYLTDLATKVESNHKSQVRETIASSMRVMADLMNADKGKARAESMIQTGNTSSRVPLTVMELMNEVIGVTDSTRPVFEMVNTTKAAVSAVRQGYREVLPKFLAKQFNRTLSKNEWRHLHLMAKTDVAALFQTLNADQIRKVLSDPKARAAEIAKHEETIKGLSSQNQALYMRKAEELAEYMVTENVSLNLLTNAEAIARLLGETKNPIPTPSDTLVQAIDRLTTLYAIDKLDEGTLATLALLSEREAEGLDFLTHHLLDLNQRERAKSTFSEEAKLNGYKGYIPSETRNGIRLQVADESQSAFLTQTGYIRVGDYKGSGTETGRKGYYFTSVGGRGTYHQGVMQTVASSAFGVDPRTGYSIQGVTAGRIPDELVGATTARLARQGNRQSGEPLIPRWDSQGNVSAYERSMAPEKLAKLSRNTHLGEMIGAWAGRQAEEELASNFNQTLVQKLKHNWTEGSKRGEQDQYVNLATTEDPIYAEAWKLIPADIKDQIFQEFGEKMFMVKKNMVNNAVGYREPSVMDAWSNNTRFDEKTQKVFRDTAMLIMGRNAFTKLGHAEKFWQAGVSIAKNTIVIRSIIVPLSNLGSNFNQLLTMGVRIRDIGSGMQTGLVEISGYLKRTERRDEIQALMARHRNDKIRMRKLETELKTLDDADKRMSIWKLVEAGEFSTISEGLTDADAAIGTGRLADWMQDKMEKVPAQFGTLGRYGMITRDTALFQGMARSTQYGDFLSKAVLYNHLTTRKKLSHDEAMKVVTEEFVNYNLLPGRVRSYAESMGLTWFWAFKLRSIKVAHRHIRDHPLRLLMTLGGSGLVPNLPAVSVGSPTTDNFIASALDGKLGYSIGPGMLSNAVGLHPWVNLAN